MLLSAGFDSRFVLGALLEQGCRPRVLTVAYPRERGLSQKLCDSLGLPCDVRPVRLKQARFRDALEAFYLVDAFYAPEAERGIRWDDPEFGLEWPVEPTVLSDKDRSHRDFDPSYHLSH